MSPELQKTDKEVALIRTAGSMLGRTLQVVSDAAKPGVTGIELDKLARETIESLGGKPAFLGFDNYPATICLSVNDGVVHGLPTTDRLAPGDVVSLDIGVNYQGWNADAATTIILEPAATEDIKMLLSANQALEAGICAVHAGAHLGDVQGAMQQVIDGSGYGNVRALTGHGIGQGLHEPPSIPNYGTLGTGMILLENMVICLEPMITQGSGKIITDKDGWTIRSADHTRAAHVEHTILVTKTWAEILTK
ncbi:MAG: type I methionyl aminopeptidase [Patescibacteria group bacterium]